ncbi:MULTISPECIES: DUF2550 domain-containing protein [Corynebacterium]|uniref:DUF2550 domain-containing protein n=1 Tax=Corynebacterium provencense TaxID=1737425 RepID=A0A2Z3YM71_9CORY|nr:MULTISPECIES: DUF2550 domain-containing protein [Corynebacterium]AWT25845.1 hypothetical protein Csp1_10400 [Corynebacterium provencense]MCI1256657.1 DUF2550 domain-containing protein [Corynebacterium provencense]
MLGTILIIVLVCLAAFAVVMACGRFLTLRSRGIPVVVRSLPNPDGRHWRHGVLVYGAMHARVFKLRSLRPESDISISRQRTSIECRRPITDKESNFLEPELHVLALDDGGVRWEVAIDDAGDTALVAWLESAPSTRSVRPLTRIDPRRGIEEY